VRYDGRHKRSAFLCDRLARFVTFVPVCPEVEVGMGVPREPIQLVGRAAAPRLVGRSSGVDWTARVRMFAGGRGRALARQGVCAYVLKRGSPSCGLDAVPVYGPRGAVIERGAGLFARAVVAALGDLPVVEEDALDDPEARDRFLERLFAEARWRAVRMAPAARRASALARFHAHHRFALELHDARAARALAPLVARTSAIAYGVRARAILARAVPIERHAAALAELAGPTADAAIRRAIDRYVTGQLPRGAVLALLTRPSSRVPLAAASYVYPYPGALV
jgi:uncharacterized protein YbbK (DUF523 family)/uncharacterized protein YbgA (DUF1722 family)